MEGENKEIIEKNVLLAEYIGYKKERDYLYMLPIHILANNTIFPRHVFVGDVAHGFKFDSDWNWLMKVYNHLFTTLDHTKVSIKMIVDAQNKLIEANKEEFFNSLVEIVKYLNKDKK